MSYFMTQSVQFLAPVVDTVLIPSRFDLSSTATLLIILKRSTTTLALVQSAIRVARRPSHRSRGRSSGLHSVRARLGSELHGHG
jgi:hypothetical protein